MISSRPLLSRSGCIFLTYSYIDMKISFVLVPFYRGAVVFNIWKNKKKKEKVLVPFYRGAVVFHERPRNRVEKTTCSRPLLSRSGCI